MIAIALTVTPLSGCILAPAPAPANYYVIEYRRLERAASPALDQPMLDQPIGGTLHVLDGRVNRTYERRQIVRRAEGPRIVYLSGDLWGVDLGSATADLIADTLRDRGMFVDIYRQHRRSLPEYEVYSELRGIELLADGAAAQARVAALFRLRRGGSDEVVAEHRFDRRDIVAEGDVTSFVRQANTILLEEIAVFADLIAQRLGPGG